MFKKTKECLEKELEDLNSQNANDINRLREIKKEHNLESFSKIQHHQLDDETRRIVYLLHLNIKKRADMILNITQELNN